MATFITSDQHFHHSNVLDFEDRPFETVEEMNERIIENWNAVVRKTDTVYVLGDFCFGGVKVWQDILGRLLGNVILVKGNHDKSRIAERMHREGLVQEYHTVGTIIKIDGFILNLTHYPMMIGERPRNFSIHGHLHSADSGFVNHINVGVDSELAAQVYGPELFGAPIPIEVVVERAMERNILLEAKADMRRAQRDAARKLN